MVKFIALSAALALALFTPLGALASPAEVAAAAPVQVEFRALFDQRGKPSERAYALNGKLVEVVGFMADRPSTDTPFFVFVGAPSHACPYCTGLDEREHVPYAFVYTEGDVQPTGLRARIRVTGFLQAEAQYENMFGIHNDLRILKAQLRRDALAVNPARKGRPIPKGYSTSIKITAENVD